MDIWPIDFDKSLKEISEWFDNWRVERYGSDSLTPERYYQVSEDGQSFLKDGKNGKELHESEKVLRYLLRIKGINDELDGKKGHLSYTTYEDKVKERETLYKAFLDEVQAEPEQAAPEPQQIPKELRTDVAKEMFKRALGKGFVVVDGDRYKWKDTASLYGYFVDKTSDYLNLRSSNNRIP